MMTQTDCMRKAWDCLFKGDLAGRDYWCDMAKTLLNARDRVEKGEPIAIGELIAVTVPDEPKVIYLPDLSK